MRGTLHRAWGNLRRILAGGTGQIGCAPGDKFSLSCEEGLMCEPGCTFRHSRAGVLCGNRLQDLVEVKLLLWLKVLRQPCPRRSAQNPREMVGTLVPRAIGGGVAGRCEREGRSRDLLTVERIGRRDCKISSRSNYPYGRRQGMSEQIFIVRQQFAPPLG